MWNANSEPTCRERRTAQHRRGCFAKAPTRDVLDGITLMAAVFAPLPNVILMGEWCVEPFIRSAHGPGYYEFPSEALKSVMLGARTMRDDEAWLGGIVGAMTRPIPIRRAQLAPDGLIAIVA